ncbi:MAG TPA: LysR family transcriptional regulator [Methylomirabilota bacterium]|nr:LysR family transcriptional regulator [Methylomirabilota bacterium]
MAAAAATEILFLTQPAVSEHVRALEDELGVQLLDRLGRGATHTPAGTLRRSPLAQAFLAFVESQPLEPPS